MRTTGLLAATLLLLYAAINIEIVIWNFIDPKSFWDILWFISLSITVLVAIFTVIYALILGCGYLLSSDFKTSKRKRLTLILSGLGLFLILTVNYLSVEIPTYLINKSISNKYKRITSSEKLIDDGRYKRAILKSQRDFERASKDTITISRLWFLQHRIENSENGLLKKNADFISSLNNYAFCLLATAYDIDSAENLFGYSIKYIENKLPNRKDYLLFPYTQLLAIHLYKYDLATVNYYHDKILRIQEELLDEDIVYAVENLILYSFIAQFNGDILSALNARKQAFKIYEQSGESKKSRYYISLALLVANDLINSGEIEHASGYLESIRRIARKYKSSYEYDEFISTLAQLEMFYGNHASADKHLKQLLKTIKRKQGSTSGAFAEVLLKLGVNQYRSEDYNKASTYFQQAPEIIVDSLTRENIYYQDLLFYSGLNDFMGGNEVTAYNAMIRIRDHLLSNLNEVFPFLVIDEKEGMVAHANSRFRYINSVIANNAQHTTAAELYNNALYTKGIALISDQLIRKQIEHSNDPGLINEYNDILNRKEKLRFNMMLGNDLNTNHIEEYEKLKRIEREFLISVSSIPGYDRFTIESTDWKSVAAVLTSGEAAVEIINFPEKPHPGSEDVYYALILSRNFTNPQIVKLFNDSDIQPLLDAKGNSLQKISTIYSDESIEKLQQLIWMPIKPYLENINKVHLSVSGLLHNISFAVLFQDEPREILLLSTTRMLALRKIDTPESNNKATLLYGDIDYHKSLSISDEIDFSAKPDTEESTLQSLVRSASFNALPNTRFEIDAIQKILSYHNFTVNAYFGEHATEESLRKATQKFPFIIHIATHGFYFPKEHSQKLSEIGFLRNSGSQLINPLFRTGLLFAGANLPSDNYQTDGILTAYEISSINLLQTDLVILSACETGLGDIKGYEGVFGLNRAFKLAGANSVIVSLWKVPDKQTAMLFEYFYEFYVAGVPKHQALKAAQLKIRDIEDYQSPFYWAAFQLID